MPEVDTVLSTPQVLAMSCLDSQPIDALAAAPHDHRDPVAGAL